MGALLVNLGRESGSHDAPLLFSVSHTSQGSPAGIATTLRDPPVGATLAWTRQPAAARKVAIRDTKGSRCSPSAGISRNVNHARS